MFSDASGKRQCRTTKVKIKPTDGMKPRDAERVAQAAADAMEAQSRGNATVGKAVAAVRAFAGLSTGGKIVREYLTEFRGTGQKKHSDAQKRAFKEFMEYLGNKADMSLDGITTEDCRGFISHQLKRVSSGTAGLYRGALVTAFNAALHDSLIERNPMMPVKIPKSSQSDKIQREPFTVEELRILFNLPGEWGDVAKVTLYTGGQRMGDVLCMLWHQIDLQVGTISLTSEKTGKAILNPIIEPLREVLTRLQRNADGSGYVFPYLADAYMRSQGRVSAEFSAMLKAHGVMGKVSAGERGTDRRRQSSKTFHSFRHTAVSLMRMNAINTPDVVRATVGHDSEAIEQAYFHASLDAKRDALRSIQEALQE